ncbi:A1AG protein, partial [Bucorvus abyssinicus]|nr:A1AG protein [Bucorvus abyssinicus]
LTLLLALPLALANEPPSCAPFVPVTFDDDTIPGLMGQWTYIMGASRYPPHLEEMKVLKHAVFTLSPGSHEDEINVTEIMRVNETCVTKHSTIQVFHHNASLMHVENNVTAVANLIQSDKDLLILSHVTDNFPAVSLSARTPDLSKEQLEEFNNHLHCLGFTEEEIFFTS